HWGNTECAGRGLLALAGQGQIYEIVLKAEEEYIVHPSNVVAYTITPSPPMPFRFKSSTFRLQIPHLGFSSVLPASKFLQMIRASGAWKGLAKSYYFLRTWARRSIWGDRLFLRFQGPATILLQSRAARVSDVLTAREVDELAESPPGTVQSAMISMDRQAEKESEQKRSTTRSGDLPTRLSTASVGPGGKVEFEDAEDFKSLTPKR
ncbi:MAG: Altered inheritance of mitochondria protein 24, mitochondrial, partial [Piccolia ochrophora]